MLDTFEAFFQSYSYNSHTHNDAYLAGLSCRESEVSIQPVRRMNLHQNGLYYHDEWSSVAHTRHVQSNSRIVYLGKK